MLSERYNRHADSLTIVGILGIFSVLLFAWQVPPITDFLSHLNQVDAFWWARKHSDGLYSINWFAPNTLYYYALLLFGLAMPLLLAGKLMWIAIFGLQLTALMGLHRKLKATFPVFLLSCLLSFNLNFYWGFGNFLIAWSLFLWFIQIDNMRPYQKIILTILIIWAHVFFLLPMAIWEFLQWRIKPVSERHLNQWLPLLGVTCWFAFWMALDFGPKSSGNMTYNYSLTERISLYWLYTSVQGSLQSWTEKAIVVVVLALLLLPRILEFSKFTNTFQQRVYYVGFAIMLVGLLAPDKGMNTVRGSQRWMPFAFQLLVMATPWPTMIRLEKAFRIAIFAAAVAFMGATVFAWSRFQTEDLSGLQEAVSDIPAGSRLLTLDYVGFGQNFQTRAAMHAGDLAQIEKGAIPQSTFADNPAAFVRFSKERAFTPLLEWYPDRLQPKDLELSDVALIGGSPEIQAEAMRTGFFRKIRSENDGKNWHVYEILKK